MVTGALLAVDDMVEGIVGALTQVGVLDKTYVFYVSTLKVHKHSADRCSDLETACGHPKFGPMLWLQWSDHGYHLGSFRLAEGKMHFYEFDTRVPFLVRGPGIPGGFSLDKIVGNIDLAPTFLAIAGVNTAGLSPPMDGRSILPLVTSPPTQNDAPPQLAASAGDVEVMSFALTMLNFAFKVMNFALKMNDA